MKLGAQFYSIRNHTQTPEELYESFKAMKSYGYSIAQMSGICQMDPYVLKSYIEEFDLPVTCTHSRFDRITDDTDALIKEHKIYGCDTIGLGMMPGKYLESAEGVRAFIKDMAEPIRRMKAEGITFAYHNHAKEFEDLGGINAMDILLEESEDINFILDTYWVRRGGADNLDMIKRIGAGRMKNLHLKDLSVEPDGPECPIGLGVIDFKPIVALCDELGIPNALIEQEGLDKSNCLMIGNDRLTDIDGAKNAGLATLYMHTALTPADQKAADPALLPGKAPAGTRHFEFEGDDWTVLGDLICKI